MDCPSEENIVRLKLDGLAFINKLEFDLDKRILTVYHTEETNEIQSRLEELDLDSKYTGTDQVDDSEISTENIDVQSKLLWSVLIINFGFLPLNSPQVYFQDQWVW